MLLCCGPYTPNTFRFSREKVRLAPAAGAAAAGRGAPAAALAAGAGEGGAALAGAAALAVPAAGAAAAGADAGAAGEPNTRQDGRAERLAGGDSILFIGVTAPPEELGLGARARAAPPRRRRATRHTLHYRPSLE